MKIRRFASTAIAAAVLHGLAIFSLAAPSVQSFTTGTNDPGTVYRGDRLAAFIEAAKNRRVDIGGIGDSNQIFTGGIGHDGGQQLGWANSSLGLYGSGVLPYNAQGGWQTAGEGATPGGPFAVTSTPTQFATVAMPASMGFPDGHAFLPASSSLGANTSRVVMDLPGTAPWGNGTQKWHWTHGTFTDGGTFAPSARSPSSTNIVASKIVSTVGVAGGLVDDSLTIPANSGPLWLEPTKLFEQSVQGTFFAQWQRVESVGKNNGVAYSTLLYQGGQTTRDAANSLAAAPDGALAEWIRQTTRLQGVAKSDQRLMIQIIQGGNDLADGTPAFGSSAPTNTPAGYAANLRAVTGRLRTVWAANGYEPSNINFVIGAYHGRPLSQVADYAAFEEAAMGVADQFSDITVVRGTKLFSYRTMEGNNWYFAPGDYPHLSNAGYIGVGRITVNTLTSLAADRTNWSVVSSLSAQLDELVPTLSTNALSLLNTTTGQTIPTEDMTLFYDESSNIARWTFPGQPGGVLPLGDYRLTISAPGMTTPYITTFSAVPEPGAACVVMLGGVALLRRRRRMSSKLLPAA